MLRSVTRLSELSFSCSTYEFAIDTLGARFRLMKSGHC